MSASWDAQLAQVLSSSLLAGSWIGPFAVAFAGGVLTALTPCVYPLVPITVRYFVLAKGGRERIGPLVVMYALGMVGLYAALGTLFASTHTVMGRALAHPWVLLGMAVFCALMALSMLGVFTLQLPAVLSARLVRVGHASMPGALLMGLVSGLVAAPCTGPVTAVILAVIAAKGEVLFGFYLMCGFGLGVAIPFLIIAGLFAKFSKIPSAGPWMHGVKIILSLAMLWVAWLFLGQAYPQIPEKFQHMIRGKSSEHVLADAIVWETDHAKAVQKAKEQHKPMMVDFTAQWCQACQELEHKTFVDPRVRAEAQRFVALKIDATTIDDAVDALFKKYGVLGLPAVVFVSSEGVVLQDPRVTGFVPASDYWMWMQKVH
jgi:thiol:disulfide interchange protein DsbD